MLTRKKCCCHSATVRLRTAVDGPCPYGRVRLWDGGGALMADDVADGDGLVRLPLPAASVSGWQVRIEDVPRGRVKTWTGAAFNSGASYTVQISSQDDLSPGLAWRSSSDGPNYLGAAAGYLSTAAIPYPQSSVLTFDDSGFGLVAVAGNSLGQWSGTSAGYTFAIASVGGSLQLAVRRTSPVANYSACTVAVTSAWTPGGGGTLATATCGGSRTLAGGPHNGAYTARAYE